MAGYFIFGECMGEVGRGGWTGIWAGFDGFRIFRCVRFVEKKTEAVSLYPAFGQEGVNGMAMGGFLQAAACGSGPPHKCGRPGSELTVPRSKNFDDRSPYVGRGNFRPDNFEAPGFLKGPAGPLSRAPRGGTAQAKQGSKGCAATAKHRKIALVRQMPGGGAMAVFVTAE